MTEFQCPSCGHQWTQASPVPPLTCPKCGREFARKQELTQKKLAAEKHNAEAIDKSVSEDFNALVEETLKEIRKTGIPGEKKVTVVEMRSGLYPVFSESYGQEVLTVAPAGVLELIESCNCGQECPPEIKRAKENFESFYSRSIDKDDKRWFCAQCACVRSLREKPPAEAEDYKIRPREKTPLEIFKKRLA